MADNIKQEFNSEDISKVTKAASTRPLVQNAPVKSSSVQRSAYDPGFDADGGTEFDPELDLREDDGLFETVWDSVVESANNSDRNYTYEESRWNGEALLIWGCIAGVFIMIVFFVLLMKMIF